MRKTRLTKLPLIYQKFLSKCSYTILIASIFLVSPNNAKSEISWCWNAESLAWPWSRATPEDVIMCIRQGSPFLDVGQFRSSACHYAVQNSPSETALALIELDICYSGDSINQTPLHIAASAGRYDLVSALLDSGVNVNPMTISGDRTPLDYAIQSGHNNVANLIRRHGGR